MITEHAMRAKEAAVQQALFIHEMMRAFDALNSGDGTSVVLDGEVIDGGGDVNDAIDAVVDMIKEHPLEVLVREGWRRVADGANVSEYALLLTTEPFVRVTGAVDGGGSVETARMEWRVPDGPWVPVDWLPENHQGSLADFAGFFYFGSA